MLFRGAMCMAAMSWLLHLAVAASDPGCNCAPNDPAVCGFDGTEYACPCKSRSNNTLVAYPGPCQPGCSECAAAGWQPVCPSDKGEGITFGNTCFAKCSGVQSVTPGTCSQLSRKCICTLEFRPMCGMDGQTYPNTCSCHEMVFVSSGACSGAATEAQPSSLPGPPPSCKCTKEYNPVCGADGRTYPNRCMAACAGTTAAAKGPCKGPSLSTSPACASCPDMVKDPICVLLTKNGSSTKEYYNPCYAACDGVDTSSTYYKGGCSRKCDYQCGPSNKATPDPVCCEGAEYPSQCHYKCLTGTKKAVADLQCKRGPCQGPAALALASSPCTGAMARCKADPCETASCPGVPSAMCHANYCQRFIRFTFLPSLCHAYFISQEGQLLGDKECGAST